MTDREHVAQNDRLQGSTMAAHNGSGQHNGGA